VLTAIIDLKMNNLGSVSKALEICGSDSIVVDRATKLKGASAIVLPGVGSFGSGMKYLKDTGLDNEISETVLTNGVPILGICLGMHLMSDWGEEGGLTKGLSLIEGEVKRIDSQNSSLRLPHVGWNEVDFIGESRLFKGIKNHQDFYFVHSYRLNARHSQQVLATTPYGEHFASCVKGDGPIFGVQFHPEKSSQAGFSIIRNFLDIAR